MKVKISVLALTAVLLMGLSTNALAVNSFNFLGESSWTVNQTESFPDPPQGILPIPMTGAISKLGPNYYLFQGCIQIPNDGPFLLAGSGNIIGSTLYLTLSTSQKHTDNPQQSSFRDSSVIHCELNVSDLSGTFYEVGHDFDRVSNHFSERFAAGNLSAANPFINLNPGSGAPVTSLLLE